MGSREIPQYCKAELIFRLRSYYCAGRACTTEGCKDLWTTENAHAAYNDRKNHPIFRVRIDSEASATFIMKTYGINYGRSWYAKNNGYVTYNRNTMTDHEAACLEKLEGAEIFYCASGREERNEERNI